MVSARVAIAGIKPGTPDCLRAQDIVMASKAELENKKNRRSSDEESKSMTRGPKGSDKFSPADLICRGA
jgi:hypothetical protein